MRRPVLIASLVFVALGRCALDLPAGLDAGTFACTSDTQCAPGWFCFVGRCTPEGDGRDSGAGGGAGGGTAAFHAALRFTTPPQTVALGACSEPVTFELVDDAGFAIAAPMDITVIPLAPGLQVFGDTVCSSPLVAMPIRSMGSFHFSGPNAGQFDVTVSGPGLEPATQSQNVVAPGAPYLVIGGTQLQPALAGACLGPITVELRDGFGNPLPAPDGGLTLTLTSQPSGLRFSPGPGCSPGTVAVAERATATSFQVSSVSGRDYTVTVSAPGFDGGTFIVPLRPLVHSGSCNLAQNQAVRSCTIAPPLLDTTRTFLTYQASGNQNDPQQSSVACVLTNADTVTCQRFADGGIVTVGWQTAELQGARVDRHDFVCPSDGGSAVIIPLAQSVPVASQFVLTAASATGGDLSGNDFFTVTPSPTQLTVQWSSNDCALRRGQLQVVQVPGFTTSRLGGVLSAGEFTGGDGGLPVPAGDTFALAQWRLSSPGGGENRVCDRLLRAETVGTTSVRVSRGAGNTGAQCTEFDIDAWQVERVDVGQRGRVQALTFDLAAGEDSMQRTIASVDVTRTVVLVSGQSGGAGQSVGEGAYDADAGGFLGEAAATVRLNSATQVQLDREGIRGAAVFTVYVVELEP